MHREPAEVTAAVRRRLGLAAQDVVVVPEPGRHARVASLRSRFSLSSAHLALLAVLLAGGLVIAAWSVLRGAPTTSTVPMAHTTPMARTSPSLPTTPTSPSGSLVIDVAGKVRRPGVATLPVGSRVMDAIRRAGGAKPGVDLTGLNLARALVDGEQIVVGGATGPAAVPSGSSVVNLNSATEQDLEALPGVGPVTAGKILAWRTAHGTFTAVEDLLQVGGIGEKTLADLTPLVTV